MVNGLQVRYRDAALRAIALAWCEEHNIPYRRQRTDHPRQRSKLIWAEDGVAAA
jgi:hypothetical protein